MAIPISASLDLQRLELLNARLHQLTSAPTTLEGLYWYNPTAHQIEYWDNLASRGVLSSRTTLDQVTPPAGNVNMNGFRMVGAANPIGPQDLVTKAYADASVSGLDTKLSVRAATAGVLPNTPAYVNGTAGVGATLTATASFATFPAQDGVTLLDDSQVAGTGTGQRLLVKDQVNQAHNGIYYLTERGSGSVAWVLTRAPDADSSTSTPPRVTAGMYTFIEEGLVNDNRGYQLITNNPITMGTTGLAFTIFSGAGQLVDDGSSTLIAGNVVSVRATWNGQIGASAPALVKLGVVDTGTWQATPVAVGFGGTGATTALSARTNLGVARAGVAITFGSGILSYTLTHNLNTQDVVVQVYDLATLQTVLCDVVRTTVNSVTLNFGIAPGTNALRAVIIPIVP